MGWYRWTINSGPSDRLNWNDTLTVRETEEIIEAAGGKKAFIDKIGLGLAVGYTASKILWLKSTSRKTI